jgi:hypothetical protein
MQQYVKIFIILYLYETQHVSGDTRPIIRSQNRHWQPLVFHKWKAVVRVVGGRCKAQCDLRQPTTPPTAFHIWKIRGCQCRFRLLMMGGVSPETCWASYKYVIIKILTYYCILLDFSYELYYDARIHEHQVRKQMFVKRLSISQTTVLTAMNGDISTSMQRRFVTKKQNCWVKNSIALDWQHQL